MRTTEAYPQLITALDDLRRRWRGQKLLEGVLLTAAGVLAVLVLTVMADNWLQPELAGRLVLTAALWLMLVAGLMRWIVSRWLEDRRDDFFAAIVEQKHPELHNQLINALQLGRGNQNGFSPRLIEAIVSDAAQATADLDMADSLDWRPAKRAALAVAAVMFGLVIYVLLVSGARFGNGLARVLLPLADIPPFSETLVADGSVKPGNARVPEGTAVAVEVKVQGVRPQMANVMRNSRGHWIPAAMQADKSGDLFRGMIPGATESFEYYVTAGDGRSKQYMIDVVKRPQIAGISLIVTPPPYTELPRSHIDKSDGEINALAGTFAVLTLISTKPLQEASLITDSGASIQLAYSENAQTWTTFFAIGNKSAKPQSERHWSTILAPARYQIKLLDTDGFENADPLWHSIHLLKDQPPSVAITSPGRDVPVKPDAVVPLAIDARDDYGLAEVRVLCRVNDEQNVREVAKIVYNGPPELQKLEKIDWKLVDLKLKGGDLVQYWAVASDRNNVTGPGVTESRRYSLFVTAPEQIGTKLDLQIDNYVAALEELVKLQRENRAQTASGVAFDKLTARESDIHNKTRRLARAMEKDALPTTTIIKALDDLAAGLMGDAIKLLESGRDAGDAAKSDSLRMQALPVQDKIIAELEALLARLQRNEQAKEAIRKMVKNDPNAHKATKQILNDMIKSIDQLLKDETQTAGKFERLPKKPTEELTEEALKAYNDLDELKKKAEKWQKGSVNELTKLPEGFVKDFDLRPDVNKIYEEVEKAAQRAKAEKMEVSLEDLGAGLATKMKEDLEMWLPDSPDNVKWVLEEPLDKKRMQIPEMPLPKATQDLIGELLQKAEEFDTEADDVTSAWGDNLDQAGWGVSDGPISSFSAKGKTGNDQPNSQEVSGRSQDGRRGKSSGQMVGDTSRGLEGRKTPARVNNERYEPGQIKQEGSQDPNGATGGGKVAGAGRKGLQGGTPPPEEMKRDFGRLGAKQAGLREQAEQVARKLDAAGVSTTRLNQSIDLMKSAEQDLRDLRYEDAARKRKQAMSKLQGALRDVDGATKTEFSRARDLPPELRRELMQSADEGYPSGYEALLKSYYKALSTGEK
jgi:hypothetical protein